MNLMVVGINHKTAPVEVREKFAFSAKQAVEANLLLKQSAALSENLVLSTCNRTEIYAVYNHDQGHAHYLSGIEDFLARYHNLDIAGYKDNFYVHKDKDAIEHLFKVASGLDSMVIGEVEILAQVKKAYSDARQTRTTGKVLNRLFEKSFNTAKKIRSDTSIVRGAVSAGSVAVRLAKKILGTLRDKKVLIIGAGKVGENLVLYLKKEGIGSILVTNRTREKAESLAGRFNALPVSFEDFRNKLPGMDIVITSTGAPHFILSKEEILALMPRRKQRPLFIIDLAVPRDVEAGANDIDNLYLYDIDDLQKTVDETHSFRKNELDACRKIISASSQNFMRWFSGEGLHEAK